MTEIDVMSQQKDKQQFTDVFLLLVAIQCLIPFELVPDVRQLLIDALYFRLFTFA